MLRLKYIFFLLLLVCGAVYADVSSTFDTDIDGWTVVDMIDSGGPYEPPIGYYTPIWVSTGGDPGGYLSASDPSSYAFGFGAPSKYLGDKSSYYGGSFNFSFRCTQSNWTKDNVVIFVGANKVIVSEIAMPLLNWSSRTIKLVESNFKYNNKNGAVVSETDFRNVLKSLTAVRILGEYGNTPYETTDIDTVVMKQLPIVACNNKVLRTIAARNAASKYRFRVWGKVRFFDSSYFGLDDGSKANVMVYAPGYALGGATYASATGVLDSSTNPPTIRCTAADVMRR